MIATLILREKLIGHRIRLQENGDLFLSQVGKNCKKPPFCLFALANHAESALISRKILRSKDAQGNTRESPQEPLVVKWPPQLN